MASTNSHSASSTIGRSKMLAGDLHIYSAPRALLRHIQWSLNSIFDSVVTLEWVAQPLAAGASAMSLEWRSPREHASTIASTLKSWHFVRFEVREYPIGGGEGVLYRCAPDLGLHQAVTSSTGDVMIHENRIRTLMDTNVTHESLHDALDKALGTQWDQELECYRLALEPSEQLKRISM